MSAVKKIIIFFSIILLYFVVKEFLSLYLMLSRISQGVGIAFIALSLSGIVYFALIPGIHVYKMSTFESLESDLSKAEELRGKRIERF